MSEKEIDKDYLEKAVRALHEFLKLAWGDERINHSPFVRALILELMEKLLSYEPGESYEEFSAAWDRPKPDIVSFVCTPESKMEIAEFIRNASGSLFVEIRGESIKEHEEAMH